MEMPVSREVLGRVFDGLGRPKDGLPDPIADKFIDINGEPMNQNNVNIQKTSFKLVFQ